MKTLLAAKFIPSRRPIGGVQSWIHTVATELERIGHQVTMWAPGCDPIWNKHFDLGILAHYDLTGGVAELCDRVQYVSHGIIDPEKPAPSYRVAFTSEGVRNYWDEAGVLPTGHLMTLLRQPIDLDFWKPADVERSGVVRYSYRIGLDWLAVPCKRLGMSFEHVNGVTASEARSKMQGAACVLATGRAALEAMACGAPVVFVDHRRAYQGPLLATNINQQMVNNYSGRGGVEPTAENMQQAIAEAIDFGSMRFHVEQFHDVRKVINGIPDTKRICLNANLLDFMESILTPDSQVIEFGAGWSSRWFADRCGHLLSIETDPTWLELAKDELEDADCDWDICPRSPTSLPEADLVLVDNRPADRSTDALRAWSALKIGGWLVVDDAQRFPDLVKSINQASVTFKWDPARDLPSARERISIAWQKTR